MDKRKVSRSTLFNLIKSRGPIGFVGIIFTSIALFVIFPVTIYLSSMGEPYEKYDTEAIMEKGVTKTARISDVTSLNNVSVNGNSPLVITYTFEDGGENKADKFQTMDFGKLRGTETGDSISIKVLDGESAIIGMEPFRFPYFLFLILPFIFLTVGLVFLVIGVLPALKTYKLYKNGDVKEAYITAMVANSGMPVTGFGRSIMVDYYYTGRNGGRIYGNSRTTDFSILGEKKVGEPLKIFVSPENENISCVIPRAESFKNNWKL